MLNHPTLEKLHKLRLNGMAKGFTDQAGNPDADSLHFEERLGLLADREMTERDSHKLRLRLKTAKLRYDACVEDIDHRTARGIDKSLLMQLISCDWVRQKHNLILVGSTGTGKTYLSCALGNKACREGMNVVYRRLPRLLEELHLAVGEGRQLKLLAAIAKVDLLILDDWGLTALGDQERRLILEILEDRHGNRSTLVTSQFPVEHWHESIGDPTLADAILDRLVHNAYRITMKGESMRKTKASLITKNPVRE